MQKEYGPYQVIKNVPLMNVYSDKGLKFGSFDLGQIFGGNIDKNVEQIEKALVRLCPCQCQ